MFDLLFLWFDNINLHPILWSLIFLLVICIMIILMLHDIEKNNIRYEYKTFINYLMENYITKKNLFTIYKEYRANLDKAESEIIIKSEYENFL